MTRDASRLLSDETVEDQVFEGLELPGGDLAGKDWRQCVFKNCRFPDARWLGSRLEDCRFEGCDLTNFRPKGMGLHGVTFDRTKLIGARWVELGVLPSCKFTDCDMRYNGFQGISFRKTSFSNSAMIESTFVRVDLVRAQFKGCDLEKAQFEACDLSFADFSEARGLYFDPARNTIKGAKIPVETAALMAIARGLSVVGYGSPPKR